MNGITHWYLKVTDATISDNQVAIELLTEMALVGITIQLVCADAGYRGKLGDWLYLTHQCPLEIAPPLGQSGVCGCPIALDQWSAPFLGSVGFAD